MSEPTWRPRAIDGPRRGQFVCPWCGATFEHRFVDHVPGQESLQGHWLANPACSGNRAVNNPTQTKYDVVEPETGLRLVDREDRDA